MGIRNRQGGLSETEIHDLLGNERRQQVIKQLQRTVGTTSLRDLAERIAEYETGESPPPRNIRDSVYNSLHQTHLPKLDRQGIVEYDSDRKTIRLTEEARSIEVYMSVVTEFGVTWAEFYRSLGTLALFVILAALLGAPVLSAVEPLLWTSLFLGMYALAMVYQLWTQRWLYLNALLA